MRRLLGVILVLALASLTLVSCSTTQEAPQQGMHPVQPIRPAPAVPPPPPRIYAYSDANLDALGLEETWERGLCDKQSPTVRDAYLLGNYILVETSNLKLYGLNRKSGQPEFVVTLTDPMDVRACEDDDFIYAVTRDVLVAVDKRAFVAYRKPLKFAPASQMIADETNIYMGCYDGKIRAFRKAGEPRYFDWKQTTMGVVSSRPAIGSKLVYAASEDGKVYALSPADGQSKWEFKTLSYVRGDVAFANRTVYVASSDGSVYALRDLPQVSREAQQAWPMPYASGKTIMSGPVVLGGTVYVVNEARECHAIDAATGKGKWILENINKVLSRGELNTYLLRDNRYILAADNESGEVHWMLDLQPRAVTRFLTNPTDDILYLVRDDGSTISVRERRPEVVPKAKELEAAEAAAGL